MRLVDSTDHGAGKRGLRFTGSCRKFNGMAKCIEIELPDSLASLSFTPQMNRRLQHLLDKQDQGEPLTEDERTEAESLVDLSEVLSLIRAKSTPKSTSDGNPG